MTTASSDALLERLLRLHPKVIDLDLGRITRLLHRLGSPHRRLPPVIHLAGTNGKGSVIAYLRAVMEAAGLTVHVYTSPHLIRFHERIRLGAPGGGGLIGEDTLAALLRDCEEANGGEPVTFFEITTAAAFLAFSQAQADYLLLETGLGGRLDATNVVERPALCALTAIALDHQQFLGPEITDIAREKAGIFKPGVTAVVAPQPHDRVLPVLEAAAQAIGAPLRIAGRDWRSRRQRNRLVYEDEAGCLDLPAPALGGAFQFDNAAVCAAIVAALDDVRLTRDHLAQGLTQARWPARLQRLTARRLAQYLPPQAEVWLDGGHNPHAAHGIAATLAQLETRDPRPTVLIAGLLKTKAAGDYLAAFGPHVACVLTLTIPDQDMSFTAQELAETAWAQGLRAHPCDTLPAALARACAIHATPRILIAGSLYLAGHVLKFLDEQIC